MKHRPLISASLCLLILASAGAAEARPVSYAGGWMAMTMNDPWSNSASLLYSPTATFAIGPFAEHYRDTDGELYGLQANWLAKRWNMPDSQGNFYLLSGLGVTSEDNTGGFIGAEADWEDRRFYLSAENRYTFAGDDVKEEYQQRARVGVAPYIAEYGGIHTWLMLQADHMPEDEDSFSVTPLVRVFHGSWLAEAGVNNKRGALFNLTFTY